MIYAFGAFELNPRTGELRKSGLGIKLGGQPRQVLTLLVERHGALVTRQEIKEALWNDATFTDFEHGVDTAIERIRRTLDDSARTPRFIETLPRQGYRFVAPVHTKSNSSPLGDRVLRGAEPRARRIPLRPARGRSALGQIPYKPATEPLSRIHMVIFRSHEKSVVAPRTG